jgi:KDO2-lipid IV(A) lauroyltransferase
MIFKILGLKTASNFSSQILKKIGPLFRSKKLIEQNILKAFPNINEGDLKKICNNMWGNYGRILSEYVFLKNFRKSDSKSNLEIVKRTMNIIESKQEKK